MIIEGLQLTLYRGTPSCGKGTWPRGETGPGGAPVGGQLSTTLGQDGGRKFLYWGVYQLTRDMEEASPADQKNTFSSGISYL